MQLWISIHFYIQGLQVNVHEIFSMQLLSWVEFNATKELFWADSKKFSKGRKFRCVHDFGTCRPKRAGVAKIRLADLLKIHFSVELDPQDVESSKRETASFCSRLTLILQDKKQTDDQNQNILKFFWNRCHFGLSRKVINATFCHSSCPYSAMLWWTVLSLTPTRCCHCWSN